ncbi:MAG: hypothetical protein GOV02_03595 [Candidatus Aenigmarchaeota archaeon]|nr:hypothetical protein [Candidatus Aenigmarchaeota archaeon]
MTMSKMEQLKETIEWSKTDSREKCEYILMDSPDGTEMYCPALEMYQKTGKTYRSRECKDKIGKTAPCVQEEPTWKAVPCFSGRSSFRDCPMYRYLKELEEA